MPNNVYVENEKDRNDYLRDMADTNDVDFATVSALTKVLGENEDFDGLISELEDIPMNKNTYIGYIACNKHTVALNV
jgi:hypothetical protein